MTPISLSRVHYPVQALGPGRRVGIWLQGCSIRCPGCISRDTWAAGTDRTTVEDVLDTIADWADRADGLTISGGEPLDQPEALDALVRGWRLLSDSPVLLFTGYDFNKVADWLALRSGLIDAVMAGPFDRAAGQTLALRGSDNQCLHILSEAGNDLASFERTATPADRKLDIMFDADGSAWFAGIPEDGVLRRLRVALHAAGHQAMTSDQAGCVT